MGVNQSILGRFLAAGCLIGLLVENCHLDALELGDVLLNGIGRADEALLDHHHGRNTQDRFGG